MEHLAAEQRVNIGFAYIRWSETQLQMKANVAPCVYTVIMSVWCFEVVLLTPKELANTPLTNAGLFLASCSFLFSVDL